MAVLSREYVSAGLKDVEYITYVKTKRPGILPIVGALATRRLVESSGDTLLQDFPNDVKAYSRSLLDATQHLTYSRDYSHYIVVGEAWAGVSMESYTHIGMLTARPNEIPDMPETSGGINVAAWLSPFRNWARVSH